MSRTSIGAIVMIACGAPARPIAPPLPAAPAPAIAWFADAEVVVLEQGIIAFALDGRVRELGRLPISTRTWEDGPPFLGGDWIGRDRLIIQTGEREVVQVTPAGVAKLEIPKSAFARPKPKPDDDALVAGSPGGLTDHELRVGLDLAAAAARRLRPARLREPHPDAVDAARRLHRDRARARQGRDGGPGRVVAVVRRRRRRSSPPPGPPRRGGARRPPTTRRGAVPPAAVIGADQF